MRTCYQGKIGLTKCRLGETAFVLAKKPLVFPLRAEPSARLTGRAHSRDLGEREIAATDDQKKKRGMKLVQRVQEGRFSPYSKKRGRPRQKSKFRLRGGEEAFILLEVQKKKGTS